MYFLCCAQDVDCPNFLQFVFARDLSYEAGLEAKFLSKISVEYWSNIGRSVIQKKRHSSHRFLFKASDFFMYFLCCAQGADCPNFVQFVSARDLPYGTGFEAKRLSKISVEYGSIIRSKK